MAEGGSKGTARLDVEMLVHAIRRSEWYRKWETKLKMLQIAIYDYTWPKVPMFLADIISEAFEYPIKLETMTEIAEEFGLIGPDQRLLYGLVFEANVLEQLGTGEGESTAFKLTDQFSEWLREQKLTIEMGPDVAAPTVPQPAGFAGERVPKLLISIAPEFAREIFSGKKKIELRKRRPKFLQPGDRVLVYASPPSETLAGELIVKNIVEGTPQELWDRISAVSGVSKEFFDDYYKDHTTAVGLIIERAVEYPNKIGLDEIKRAHPEFSPPKNYRYITEGDPLLGLARKAAEKR